MRLVRGNAQPRLADDADVGQRDAAGQIGPLARLLGRPVIFNPLVTLTDTVVEDRGRFTPGSPPARAAAAIASSVRPKSNSSLYAGTTKEIMPAL